MPVETDKVLYAVGETYDFIVTIPVNRSLEIRATAQDGSGYTNVILGKGDVDEAQQIEKPDLIQMMKDMGSMNMSNMNMSMSDMSKMSMNTIDNATMRMSDKEYCTAWWI